MPWIRWRRLEFLQLGLIRHAESAGCDDALGAPSMTMLLRGRLRLSPGEAASRVRAARALCGEHTLTAHVAPPTLPATAHAAAAGDIGAEHVRVIERTIDKLPAESRSEADTILARRAVDFDPSRLAYITRRLRYYLNPQDPKPEEIDRQRDLYLLPDLPGTVNIQGTCLAADAATIRAAIDPLAAPRAEDTRSPGQRQLDALVEICRRRAEKSPIFD